MKPVEILFIILTFLGLCFADYNYQETKLFKSINKRFDILQTVADQDYIGASLAVGFHGNIDTFRKFADYKVSGAVLAGHGKNTVIIPGSFPDSIPNKLGIWDTEKDIWFGLDLDHGYHLLISSDKKTTLRDFRSFSDFQMHQRFVSTTFSFSGFLQSRILFLIAYILSPIGFLAFLRVIASRNRSLLETKEAKKEASVAKIEAIEAKEDSKNKTHDARLKAITDYAYPALQLRSAFASKDWNKILQVARNFEIIGDWVSSVWSQSTKPEDMKNEEFNVFEAVKEILDVVSRMGFVTSYVKIEISQDYTIYTGKM